MKIYLKVLKNSPMLSKRCFYIKYFLHKKYNALCKYGCIILTMIRTRRRWIVYVKCVGKKKGAYRVLVVKPEGKT